MAGNRPGSLARDALFAMGPKPMEDEESTGEGKGVEDEGFSEVADQLFDAQKSGDREGFKDALKAAIESCMGSSGESGY